MSNWIIWNFKNPISFIGCCVWNIAEYFNLSLGRIAPYVFGIASWTNCKRKKDIET